MNNRGEISDMLIFVITVFILAIGFFILIFIIPSITTGLRTAGMNSTTEGNNAIQSLSDIGTHTINNGFMLLFVGLILSVMITSFMVRSHPIFLFLYIFSLAITLLLAVYLGNAYYDLQNNIIFASTVNDASFINVVLNHIVEIACAVGALSLVIVFAKPSSGGGQPF
jgi:hypothetical protein